MNEEITSAQSLDEEKSGMEKISDGYFLEHLGNGQSLDWLAKWEPLTLRLHNITIIDREGDIENTRGNVQDCMDEFRDIAKAVKETELERALILTSQTASFGDLRNLSTKFVIRSGVR